MRRSFRLFLPFFLLGIFPVWGIAEVNVNIGFFAPPPPLMVVGPPVMAVVPGTSYVYFAPDIAVDLFFYGGYWYRPHEGHWFRARSYRGPWKFTDYRAVPAMIHHIPPGYRKMPPGHMKIPYGQVQKHWKDWERERHFDRWPNDYRGHSVSYKRQEGDWKGGGHFHGQGRHGN